MDINGLWIFMEHPLRHVRFIIPAANQLRSAGWSLLISFVFFLQPQNHDPPPTNMCFGLVMFRFTHFDWYLRPVKLLTDQNRYLLGPAVPIKTSLCLTRFHGAKKSVKSPGYLTTEILRLFGIWPWYSTVYQKWWCSISWDDDIPFPKYDEKVMSSSHVPVSTNQP